MKYFLFFVFLSISIPAVALKATGNVKDYRTFPNAQAVAAARNHVVFDLDTPLDGGCDLLFLTPEDKASMSLVLAAKMAKTKLTVTYNTTPAPWSHAATCTALEVSAY